MKNNYLRLASALGFLFMGTLFSGCEFPVILPPEVCPADDPCGGPPLPEVGRSVSVEARNLIVVEKDGEKRILLGTNFDTSCATLESLDVGTHRGRLEETRNQVEITGLTANLSERQDVICAAVYRPTPRWYDVTALLNIGEDNVKVLLENGRRIHLSPTEVHFATISENEMGAGTITTASEADGECKAARHLQLQVTSDEARFDGVFVPKVSDPLRPMSHSALATSVRTKKLGVKSSFMSDIRGYGGANYEQALDAKIPFVEMLNSPVARDQATQINYLSLKIALTEVAGRTVQNIDMIVERDQVVDIEALKTELGVGEITLISDDSNLCVK